MKTKAMAVRWRVVAGALLGLTGCACGSYDESSGLIGVAGTAKADAAIRINEVMSRNSTVIADEHGDYDDFIELYNQSDEVVSLAGYYISDTEDSPFLWQLPVGLTIAPNGLLLLWADEEPAQGSLHLDFKLSGDGDGVWLTSPDGQLVDSVTFGASGGTAASESSYARHPDGAVLGQGQGAWSWCSRPTPLQLNGASCLP